MKIPPAPIDESMILASSTRSALMDTTCLSSIYRNEIEGVSSGAWVIKLMEEIDEPDQPHPSVFDDSDEEDIDRQSSDKSRIYSFAQVGASVSTAGVRLSSMAPAIKVVELIPLVDIDREPSWESPCREFSLVAASDSAAVALPQERDPATTDAAATASASVTAATDKEQASRKRKATTNTSVNRKKRDLAEPPSQRHPSPIDDLYVREEDIRDDDVLKGRGGLSIRHEGNKRFRKIVENMKETYQNMCDKTDKTALSRAIVEYIHKKGGRFLIKNSNGQVGWRVMTKAESREKTSQALRET